MASSPIPDSTLPDDIKPIENKALIELRLLLEDALTTNNLPAPSAATKKRARVANSSPDLNQEPLPAPSAATKKRARVANSSPDLNQEPLTDASLWGIPILPSKHHECTNVILLKFLRASECRPFEALEMILRTLRWRREFGVDTVADEDLEVPDFKGTAYLNGVDRDGHPVSYNVYGVFKERVLYRKAFGNEELREKFLRSRIQFMEKGIKELSFRPGGVASMLQVIDLKDSSISSLKELRHCVRRLFSILEANYPEFVEQFIFINVSFRYYTYKALFSRNISQRMKNKFIFARPNKVTETLLKFIDAEHIPVQYGGLYRADDDEFSAKNGRVSEMSLKGGSSATVEIPISEPGVTVVWDLAVVGWDVQYKEEFIPDDECSYKVLIRSEKRVEESARNSFYISEPGKVVLTVTNRTIKKKKILYRWKSKPTVPLYNLLSNPAV